MPLLRNKIDAGVDIEAYLASLGRVMVTNMGSTTTPISFASAGGVTLARPHAWVRVPTDTAIIVFSAAVELEDSAGTDNEIAAVSAAIDVANGTSSAATVAPTSTSRNLTPAYTSLCTARQLATADVTVTGAAFIELDRWVYPFADATTDPVKKYTYSSKSDWLVGPATFLLYIYGTTTAPAGFVQIRFGEVPSTWVNG